MNETPTFDGVPIWWDPAKSEDTVYIVPMSESQLEWMKEHYPDHFHRMKQNSDGSWSKDE